jgi:hypothetical protein
MNQNNLVKLKNLEASIEDPLAEVLRKEARRLLTQTVQG